MFIVITSIQGISDSVDYDVCVPVPRVILYFQTALSEMKDSLTERGLNVATTFTKEVIENYANLSLKRAT